MFKPKLEFILKMIEDIEFIINRHNHITKALEDREGQLAILMALMQIGETFKFNLLYDVKGTYSVRNFMAHDYEGVKLSVNENVLRYNIPNLKNKILKILEDKK